MIIKVIQTGETIQVNPSYGARLIEQGKAIPCPAAKSGSKKSAKKAVVNGAD